MLGGAFNTAGPPVLVYAIASGWRRDAMRANLQLFFAVVGLASTTGFALVGVIDAGTLRWNALLLPCIPLGAWLGNRLASRTDAETFRRGVLIALVAMGTWYVVQLVV